VRADLELNIGAWRDKMATSTGKTKYTFKEEFITTVTANTVHLITTEQLQ
jgi:hypothetical protein